MAGRVGARSGKSPPSGGFRSIRPSGQDRSRQRDLQKSPWQYGGRPQAALQKATGIENMMRYALLRKGINFVEQAAIGPWCVDFYLPDYNACLEADGEYWHSSVSAKMKDRRKDAWLKSRGYSVFHFDGWEIKQDSDFCVSRMMKSLEAHHANSEAIESEDNSDTIDDENNFHIELIKDNEQSTTAPEFTNDQEYEQWIRGS